MKQPRGNRDLESTQGGNTAWRMPVWAVPGAFFLVEVFAYVFLSASGGMKTNLWPLVFGSLWAGILSGIVLAAPRSVGRVVFGLLYFPAALYAAVQTGYFHFFREMVWLSEFRYASEGARFISVLQEYPLRWWVLLAALLGLGVMLVWRFPMYRVHRRRTAILAGCAAACAVGAFFLPRCIFLYDRQTQYAGTDYRRARSAEAVYTNMYHAHGLYQVCGIYQTGMKDIHQHWIYPLSPGYAQIRRQARAEIEAYFNARGERSENAMTGVFAGKNIVLVLMESMDDWALGEHTPTINRLMAEGIRFSNFYTPPYGGVRTFNTEFCVNTGSFLSSGGGYAFDYVTNNYGHSLASQLSQQGYSAKVYHYNSPSFYSRGTFSRAMGYEEYVSYESYITADNRAALYDDQFLFDQGAVSESFFREGRKLNFIITHAAHMSYRYNESLSAWGLQKYPQYRGLTGHEEEDCMYLKARLVDDMFARLLEDLEAHGELQDTVIVAFTDHYTYGIQDTQLLMERSGVEDSLLLEKTPCFIWSVDGFSMEVDKTLNTADLLPTVLNLMGISSPYQYLGQDAFDPAYPGYAVFSDGSWVSQGAAYSAASERVLRLEEGADVSEQRMEEMARLVNDFVHINNLLLETDYYAQSVYE
ncbi:MAG: LTA synthase family protein [Oscillospiraceae bacterium]|nr:LTA synthase family protein [Oscillospiraceae bacterium]